MNRFAKIVYYIILAVIIQDEALLTETEALFSGITIVHLLIEEKLVYKYIYVTNAYTYLLYTCML